MNKIQLIFIPNLQHYIVDSLICYNNVQYVDNKYFNCLDYYIISTCPTSV